MEGLATPKGRLAFCDPPSKSHARIPLTNPNLIFLFLLVLISLFKTDLYFEDFQIEILEENPIPLGFRWIQVSYHFQDRTLSHFLTRPIHWKRINKQLEIFLSVAINMRTILTVLLVYLKKRKVRDSYKVFYDAIASHVSNIFAVKASYIFLASI